MDSNLIARIHFISVMLFLVTYVIKTILIFSSKSLLSKYSSATRIPEMIISLAFLITGVWLIVIIGGVKMMQIIKFALVLISIPVAIIAFKKYKKGLALLSLILIVGAYGISEMSKKKPFLPKKVMAANSNGSTFSNGALVYYSNCSFCHGNDGKKQYRNAPDLTLSALNDDAIKEVINNGRGNMPAFISVINEADINALTVFVKGLQPISPVSQH